LDGDSNGWFDYSNSDPAIAGSPGTCSYGVLYNGAWEYGRFSVADNARLDLAESLTVAAWVRRDESGSGYILSKGSNYQWLVDSDGKFFWAWQGHYLQSEAGALPSGQWAHVAVTYKSREQHLYLNGELVASDVVEGPLPTNSEPLILGRDSFWNIFGTGTRFDGAVDELHIYSNALPAVAIREIYGLTHPCEASGLAELLISVPATASVCGPIGITIEAYNQEGALLEDYAGTVNLSTSSDHGRWTIGTGSEAGAGSLSPDPDTTDNGSASYQFAAGDNGDVTLAFTNTHADQLTFTATDQETGVTVTSEPVIFAKNALYIENNDTLGDDLIAGRTHQYQVSMLRQEPDGTQCFVAEDYEGTYSLKSWLGRQADDPGGDAPVLASGNGSVLLPDSAPPSGNLDITFDQGLADIFLTPSDVGHYTLNLLDDSSGFVKGIDGTPLPVISTSATGAWTARPFAIALVVPGNPGAQNASGPLFRGAGEPFTLRVGGALYSSADDIDGDGVANAGTNLMDNGFAPSFGQEGESVVLSAQLLAPATGVNPGLDGPVLQASDYVSGVTSASGFRFSEVGVIDIAGVIGDGNYLGAGSAYTARMAGKSGPVGRFVPDHFTVTVDDNGVLDAACGGAGGFTYSGQDSGWAVEPTVVVTPRNLAGTVTQNYLLGNFMRLQPGGISRTWPANDESALLSDETTPYPVAFEYSTGVILPRGDGDPVRYGYAADDVVRYTKSAEAVVAPFAPSLRLEIEDVRDDDGVTALETGTGSVPVALTPAANGDLRYGRRALENVYGPETTDELLMPFYMEYWTGNSFAVNELDNCTDWAADSSIDDAEQYHRLLSRGDTGTFSSGRADPLVLEPSGDAGEERLTWNLPVWQQFDWDGDGMLQSPSAIATFGVYRGNDRIIYWREVSN
jgi:MSHA biogenesis protein MshQ